ncbi:MAG: glycosyltransferase family 4 protein [Candidatus Zapsychrus exili]|nr:glycosyltransferase family 4 protein [Candidatus Zapsychrus exili]
MKILLISTHLNAGGITSYLLTLTKGFLSLGNEMYIATGGGDTEESFVSLGAKIIKLDILAKSDLDPKIYMALPKLKRLIKSYGIDIIHSNARVTQVMGNILKKLTGVPYVSTCHGFFKTRLTRRMFPCWGDKVIAISEAVENHLKNDFKISKKDIIRIENGIELNKFSVATKQVKLAKRVKFGLTDEPVLGIVARLSIVKGQDILVNAMEKVVCKIPSAKLFIIGQGKTEDDLRKAVVKLGLENNVIFSPILGSVQESLSLLDIFIMPSRQEGLGISVMEAQASGLATIASNVGGIPSLIDNGKTGVLVEPENIDELSDAIVNLLNSPDKIKQIGDDARDFALKNYSSDLMVGKTLNVYKQLINL